MYSRPKPGETDQDILRFQEEFLRNKAENKVSVASKVIRDKKEVEDNPGPSNITEQISNTFETIPTNITIGSVIERKPVLGDVKINFPHPKGFPAVKRRDPTSSNSKGSIFAQQMKKIKVSSEPKSTTASASRTKISIDYLPKESCIVSSDFKEEIHKENVNILTGMSEQEILEEREKLLSTMDPAIVAFLKSKRTAQHFESRTSSIAEQNRAADLVSLDEISISSEIITHPDAEKWLNFDVIELNKLAWMKDVDIPKFKEKSYEARFDFDGWILPFSQPEITEKNRNLYHHGEEAGRPGYTLQELFQLCRSSVNQQKIIALNAVANILALHQSGVYDNIIDLPIEQIFFVVRFCLDDNTPGILNSSVKAMRNLIYFAIDEVCLDNLLGFGLGSISPILAINKAEKEDDNTINDQQLVESDLIRCLVRTDILKRIRYIINTVKPAKETVVYCLEILIRLGRDSEFIVDQIWSNKDLIEGFLNYCLPKTFRNDDIPVMQAVKLVRILSSRSRNIANEFVNKYKITDTFLHYLFNEDLSLNSNGLRLQIECLHTWAVFVHYDYAIVEFEALQPCLLQFLNFHIHNTDVNASYTRQGHLAAILCLISAAAKTNYSSITRFFPLLEVGIGKWCVQSNTLQEFKSGKLQIISATFQCLSHLYRYKPSDLSLPTNRIRELTCGLLKSNGFDRITKDILSCSNVLNNFDVHASGSNLKSCEAAIWNSADHIVPVVQTNSCIPFLTTLSNFIKVFPDNQVKQEFIDHKNVSAYLNLLQKGDYYLISNWFTRVESSLIMNIIKMALSIYKNIDTSVYYELAVKSLSIFNMGQKLDVAEVLQRIIFNQEFYPCEVFLRNLNLDENLLLKTALNNLDDICTVYGEVLGLNRVQQDFSIRLSQDVSEGNFIPIDWIYSPLITLYSNYQQSKSKLKDDEQQFLVINCLRWIYIYETCFPSLAKLIDPTDQYCRISCTFLGSDSLFLDNDIRNLLEAILKLILTLSDTDLDFTKPITGLNNFQDFYTQLLEQYQGVSYGDVLFGNFILIPLAQKHDAKFRKVLWSEYAGIIQVFNVSPEQLICPLDSFLYPIEEDLSLLRCYQRILATGAIRKHSVLFKVASHHLHEYKKKLDSRK